MQQMTEALSRQIWGKSSWAGAGVGKAQGPALNPGAGARMEEIQLREEAPEACELGQE